MTEKLVEYGTLEYWEERYEKDPSPYDWYQRWDSIKDIVKEYLKLEDKILVIGNGTSRIPEEIYDEGFHNIQAMDVSKTAVDYMHERFASKDIKCQVSDVLDMYQYGDNEFDVVFDKGTFDTILCTKNSGLNIDRMMKEIIRILNYNKGRYICVSYGQPSYRTTYMKSMKEWEIDIIPIKKPGTSKTYNVTNCIETETKSEKDYSKLERPDLYHFIYVCTLFNKPGEVSCNNDETYLSEQKHLAGDETEDYEVDVKNNNESNVDYNINTDTDIVINAKDLNSDVTVGNKCSESSNNLESA